MVLGSGFGALGFGCRAFRVLGSGCGVLGLGFRSWCVRRGFPVSSSASEAPGSEFRPVGFGLRAWGLKRQGSLRIALNGCVQWASYYGIDREF